LKWSSPVRPGSFHEHQKHLAANVHVLVVIPAPLLGLDAVSDEHDLAVGHNVTLRPLRPATKSSRNTSGRVAPPLPRRAKGGASYRRAPPAGSMNHRSLRARGRAPRIGRRMYFAASRPPRVAGARPSSRSSARLLEMRVHGRRAHGRGGASSVAGVAVDPDAPSAAERDHRGGRTTISTTRVAPPQ